ncbi:glutamate synthase-related protein [Streptomyces californicus]|uniref:glutamate synthase-related protein n=1 Tax=Streptomyces californicus TaxID=67351 RepID=UPI0034D95F02
MIEIKLSQGARAGLGGLLSGVRVGDEIARIRDSPVGRDCVSLSRYPVFHEVDAMLDFVGLPAAETGLLVKVMSVVGGPLCLSSRRLCRV